jgi:hypothetical protein
LARSGGSLRRSARFFMVGAAESPVARMPFWSGRRPGGNIGRVTYTYTAAPSNSLSFALRLQIEPCSDISDSVPIKCSIEIFRNISDVSPRLVSALPSFERISAMLPYGAVEVDAAKSRSRSPVMDLSPGLSQHS